MRNMRAIGTPNDHAEGLSNCHDCTMTTDLRSVFKIMSWSIGDNSTTLRGSAEAKADGARIDDHLLMLRWQNN